MAEIVQTSTPVSPITTSLMPQVTTALTRVPIMSPLHEPTWTHPIVISPPVVHTFPPYHVTPPNMERAPPPQLPPPRDYNTRKHIKHASANFVASIIDEPILNPVIPQVEKFVINSKTGITR